MGKHKNFTQNSIIIEFMEKYPDIARGFTKRDKPAVDALWQQLTKSLNSAGPPQKDVNAWKKTWTEWKSDVKRKLAQNKAESTTIGGGPFSKRQLTRSEEAVIRICSIAHSVEGVSGIDIGFTDSNGGKEEEMPSTSSKRPPTPLLSKSAPKRLKIDTTTERIKKFLDDDSVRKAELSEKLDEIIKLEKENASSLRRIYRALEKGQNSITNAVEYEEMSFLQSNEESCTSPTSKFNEYENETAKRKRRNNSDDLIALAVKHLQQGQNRFEKIAEAWALQLEEMDPQQRTFAEKFISDILFEGKMGSLHREAISFNTNHTYSVLPASKDGSLSNIRECNMTNNEAAITDIKEEYLQDDIVVCTT